MRCFIFWSWVTKCLERHNFASNPRPKVQVFQCILYITPLSKDIMIPQILYNTNLPKSSVCFFITFVCKNSRKPFRNIDLVTLVSYKNNATGNYESCRCVFSVLKKGF